MRSDLPEVPLEAGAGPDNPPCPACGEPLFPWMGMPVGIGVAHRCEACGLGVMIHHEKPRRPDLEAHFDPGTTEDALKAIDAELDPDGGLVFLNRASLQASLGGGAWSALGTDLPYLFTPTSLRLLAEARGQKPGRLSWMPLRSIARMWQSGINMFTFGQNQALGAAGKGHGVPARQGWQRAIDWFITVVLALPSLVIAIPLELLGAAFRRGGVYRTRFERA